MYLYWRVWKLSKFWNLNSWPLGWQSNALTTASRKHHVCRCNIALNRNGPPTCESVVTSLNPLVEENCGRAVQHSCQWLSSFLNFKLRLLTQVIRAHPATAAPEHLPCQSALGHMGSLQPGVSLPWVSAALRGFKPHSTLSVNIVRGVLNSLHKDWYKALWLRPYITSFSQ